MSGLDHYYFFLVLFGYRVFGVHSKSYCSILGHEEADYIKTDLQLQRKKKRKRTRQVATNWWSCCYAMQNKNNTWLHRTVGLFLTIDRDIMSPFFVPWTIFGDTRIIITSFCLLCMVYLWCELTQVVFCTSRKNLCASTK